MNDHLTNLFNTIGIISVLVILFYSLVQVFDPKIKEGVIGCICFLSLSTSSLAWLVHMLQGTYPQRTTTTMFVCMALLMLRRLALSTVTWSRFHSWYTLKAKEAKAHNRSRHVPKH